MVVAADAVVSVLASVAAVAVAYAVVIVIIQ